MVELFLDWLADRAEQWAIRRRIARYQQKAALFGRGEVFQRELKARIEDAKEDRLDNSAIKAAYCEAMKGVVVEPFLQVIQRGN